MKEVVRLSTTPTVIRIRLWSELAILALIAMELTWLGAFYYGLASHRVSLTKIITVLGLMILISHLLARLVNFLRVSYNKRRAIFIVWILLCLFGSLKLLVLPNQPVGLFQLITHPFVGVINDENASFGEFWHIILTAMLIWRGVSLAASPVSVFRALRSFQIGLLILIAYGFMIVPISQENSLGILFAYLFFGVLAMAAARIAGVSELRGGKAGRFSRVWVFGITASALVLVGAGVLIASLLRDPAAWVVLKSSTVFLFLLTALALVITYPIVLIFFYLVPLISNLGLSMPEMTILNELGKMINEIFANQNETLEKLANAFNIGRAVGRVAIVIGIGLIILFALRWRPARRRNQGEEDVSNLTVNPRWPRLPTLNPKSRLARMTQARRWLAAERIRRIYGELMDLCIRLEHRRPEAMTPLEFLPQIDDLFPEHEEDLRVITNAYLKVRYGELPETPQEVQDAEAAWGRVKTNGRRMIALLKKEKKRQAG